MTRIAIFVCVCMCARARVCVHAYVHALLGVNIEQESETNIDHYLTFPSGPLIIVSESAVLSVSCFSPLSLEMLRRTYEEWVRPALLSVLLEQDDSACT